METPNNAPSLTLQPTELWKPGLLGRRLAPNNQMAKSVLGIAASYPSLVRAWPASLRRQLD